MESAVARAAPTPAVVAPQTVFLRALDPAGRTYYFDTASRTSSWRAPDPAHAHVVDVGAPAGAATSSATVSSTSEQARYGWPVAAEQLGDAVRATPLEGVAAAIAQGAGGLGTLRRALSRLALPGAPSFHEALSLSDYDVLEGRAPSPHDRVSGSEPDDAGTPLRALRSTRSRARSRVPAVSPPPLASPTTQPPTPPTTPVQFAIAAAAAPAEATALESEATGLSDAAGAAVTTAPSRPPLPSVDGLTFVLRASPAAMQGRPRAPVRALPLSQRLLSSSAAAAAERAANSACDASAPSLILEAVASALRLGGSLAVSESPTLRSRSQHATQRPRAAVLRTSPQSHHYSEGEAECVDEDTEGDHSQGLGATPSTAPLSHAGAEAEPPSPPALLLPPLPPPPQALPRHPHNTGDNAAYSVGATGTVSEAEAEAEARAQMAAIIASVAAVGSPFFAYEGAGRPWRPLSLTLAASSSSSSLSSLPPARARSGAITPPVPESLLLASSERLLTLAAGAAGSATTNASALSSTPPTPLLQARLRASSPGAASDADLALSLGAGLDFAIGPRGGDVRWAEERALPLARCPAPSAPTSHSPSSFANFRSSGDGNDSPARLLVRAALVQAEEKASSPRRLGEGGTTGEGARAGLGQAKAGHKRPVLSRLLELLI